MLVGGVGRVEPDLGEAREHLDELVLVASVAGGAPGVEEVVQGPERVEDEPPVLLAEGILPEGERRAEVHRLEAIDGPRVLEHQVGARDVALIEEAIDALEADRARDDLRALARDADLDPRRRRARLGEEPVHRPRRRGELGAVAVEEPAGPLLRAEVVAEDVEALPGGGGLVVDGLERRLHHDLDGRVDVAAEVHAHGLLPRRHVGRDLHRDRARLPLAHRGRVLADLDRGALVEGARLGVDPERGARAPARRRHHEARRGAGLGRVTRPDAEGRGARVRAHGGGGARGLGGGGSARAVSLGRRVGARRRSLVVRGRASGEQGGEGEDRGAFHGLGGSGRKGARQGAVRRSRSSRVSSPSEGRFAPTAIAVASSGTAGKSQDTSAYSGPSAAEGLEVHDRQKPAPSRT